jgi:two-component system chemotaxis response regulator CheY
MPHPARIILLVDPDSQARAMLAWHLAATSARIMQAEDGPGAMRIASQYPIAIMVTELYLPTGDDECLIHAVRRDAKLKRTRIVAHTHRAATADREWAMRAGADAYLIKPTRAQRVRYVVNRLMGDRPRLATPATSGAPMTRRDSLEVALAEIEGGGLADTSTIVFARVWWETLTPDERKKYRTRARKIGVTLRSDSMLTNHFVEVRGASRDSVGLSTERPESPYRR